MDHCKTDDGQEDRPQKLYIDHLVFFSLKVNHELFQHQVTVGVKDEGEHVFGHLQDYE